MSRLRGYCPTCNGPLWRVVDDRWSEATETRDGCRLCWLEETRTAARSPEQQPFAWCLGGVADPARWVADLESRDGWAPRVDEANSAENTAATSTWLPRVWVDGGLRGVRRSHDIAVAWFRYVDEPDALATDTLLAQSLLVEELGHPSYPSVSP